MSDAKAFSGRIFRDEDAARKMLEALRWPEGPKCPHAGCFGGAMSVAAVGGSKRSHRPGLYWCRECRGQFTVTVGTVLQGSRVPLTGWLRAAHMLSSNTHDANVAATAIQAELAVTYKTAHALMWRILNVAASFNGHVEGFGKPIRDHINGCRPTPRKQSGAVWERAKQRRVDADAILALVEVTPAAAGGLERTQRLLRLILLTDPKSSALRRAEVKSADRRRVGFKRTKHANRGKPFLDKP